MISNTFDRANSEKGTSLGSILKGESEKLKNNPSSYNISTDDAVKQIEFVFGSPPPTSGSGGSDDGTV